MKSTDAFKRTFGGGYHRIDVADGFTFDPNKHNASTIYVTDATTIGDLKMVLTAMSNGDTMRLIVNSAIDLSASGQTMYPSGFTAYGIVEFEMFDGKVYASAGADVALDALQETVGNLQKTVGDESSGLVKDMIVVKAQVGDYNPVGADINADLSGLMSTKIVVGVTPSVCTTKAYKRFGTAANHLKIEALTPGTVMNGWEFTNTGSSVSNLTASAFVSAASKLVTLRYATNTSAESVSITPASLAAVLNITPVSAYFLTTVSGTVSNFGSATGLKVFTGLTASGANNGTVAAMGKIYIASGFGAMHICVSTTDGSQVSNASYFKTVSLT